MNFKGFCLGAVYCMQFSAAEAKNPKANQVFDLQDDQYQVVMGLGSWESGFPPVCFSVLGYFPFSKHTLETPLRQNMNHSNE